MTTFIVIKILLIRAAELNFDPEPECYVAFKLKKNHKYLGQATVALFLQSGFRDRGFPWEHVSVVQVSCSHWLGY